MNTFRSVLIIRFNIMLIQFCNRLNNVKPSLASRPLFTSGEVLIYCDIRRQGLKIVGGRGKA